MPEALIWLRAYVGVYEAKGAARMWLTLLMFFSVRTTCRVHIPHVVACVDKPGGIAQSPSLLVEEQVQKYNF